MHALLIFKKEFQIDLEHHFEQAHVCTLIQPNLMFPDIDKQDLTRCQCKERTFPLKILIFASFSAICPFHIHDQYILCHILRVCVCMILLVL